MNRIYQGRTTGLELIDGKTGSSVVEQVFSSSDLKHQDNPLWKHHEIFQDAVNYYLVALAALAKGIEKTTGDLNSQQRLAVDLWKRVGASWDEFRGSREHRHLRRSLKKWLELQDDATLGDAFDAILKENDSPPASMRLALQLLLDKCGGESAIQQGGREYLPKLCVSHTEAGKAYSGTFDFAKSAIAAESGKQVLAQILHQSPTTAAIVDTAAEMDISWAGIKCKPAEFVEGEALQTRLVQAIDHLSKRLSSPSTNSETELVEKIPNVLSELANLKTNIPNIPSDLSLSVNKGGNISWDLVHSAYLFKTFPSTTTAAILALSIKKPKAINPDSDPEVTTDYTALGDDPLKIARGERGYVFPAFTALPAWSPRSQGQPVWKEFDIAAFKEALKSLNQFNQKTTERADNETYLRGKICILLGGDLPKGWSPRKTESGEAESKPSALDRKLLALAWQLEDRLTRELPDTAVNHDERRDIHFAENSSYPDTPGQWRISNASLRGFREIAGAWNKLAARTGAIPPQEELEEIVKNHQREEKNKRGIGSISLFLALCQEKYAPLWKMESDPNPEDHPEFNRFLFHVIRIHQDVRDWKRSKEPINLTPAEPRLSRRLYMFSDINGKEKTVFKGDGVFETTLAHLSGGTCRKQRARIHYSAPRLHRDQFLGGEESRWLQPMVEALGLQLPEAVKKFESAVSLMPDFDREGNTRFLLNFPKTIDESWLKEQLGKESVWNGQFNGVKDKNLHLHWPQNDPKTKQAKENPWWKNPAVIANGFTTLSIDLGQRTAGAWALLHITCAKPDTKRPVRSIGHDGEREWFAEVLKTGMLRLPGEDQKVMRPALDGKGKPIKGTVVYEREIAGKAGRNSDEAEFQTARQLAERLGAISTSGDQEDSVAGWIGKDHTEKSFPQQNNKLITLANRRLSRLATFHRWSCTATALSEESRTEKDRVRILAALFAELDHWSDPEVSEWTLTLRTNHFYLASLFPVETGKKSLSKIKQSARSWSEEQWQTWRENFQPQHFEDFSQKSGHRFTGYREELEEILVGITDRTAPLRGKRWFWKTRQSIAGTDTTYGELVALDSPHAPHEKIRGQRGLSMSRLEQLEGLRTLFLRLNRAMEKTAGKPSKAGFRFTNDSGEPCQILLDKINRMKEQRINQTAHLILAQALGVRLKIDKTPRPQREERDIHGEYEKIPNRHPVDFIVIENLDRYLTSQGRAPSENRRLMKWSHRAVRDKLKMLAEEPFGIPVAEAPAAYSSRFCAVTSQPGSRCEERTSLNKEDDPFLFGQFEKRATTAPPFPKKDNTPQYQRLLEQYAELRDHNQSRNGKSPRTLLLPKTGGPLFLSAIDSPVVQADANAAINIGLRAIAAPESLHLIHKVRSARKKDEILPSTKNARENAAFPKDSRISPSDKPSVKLAAAKNPNFFYLADTAAHSFTYDRAEVKLKSSTQNLISGIALHTTTDDLCLARIVEINARRLSKWDGDEIPM